jgi:hypothetical protein
MSYCNLIHNYIDIINNDINNVKNKKRINFQSIFWAHYKIANFEELDREYRKENHLNKMIKELNKDKHIYESAYFALGCPLEDDNLKDHSQDNSKNHFNKLDCKQIYNLFTLLQDKEYAMRKVDTSKPEYLRLMLEIENIYKTKCE